MSSADFRFVHAADLHLDTPFEGIARVCPEVAQQLQNASLQAFDNLISLTLDKNAELLLLAGDIYDGIRRGVRAQLRFQAGIRRLADAGVKICMVYGNHDPLDGWSAVDRWPDGVTVFGSSEVESVPIYRGRQRLATVYGISYSSSEVRENLALRFHRGEEEGIHIALLHTNVGSNSDHDSYAPCSLSDLQAARMDYWALGHIHKAAFLSKETPWIVYPGNLQGRSPKPSEIGEKGAMLVEVRGGRVHQVSAEPCDAVRFVPLALDISGASDLGQVKELLLEEGFSLKEKMSNRGVLVRAILQGQTPLCSTLDQNETLTDLITDLRAEMSTLDPLFFWESIKSKSRPVVDREAISRRQDFSAALIQTVDRLRENREEQSRYFEEVFAPVLRPRIAQWLPESSCAGEELLDEALDLALSLLEEESK